MHLCFVSLDARASLARHQTELLCWNGKMGDHDNINLRYIFLCVYVIERMVFEVFFKPKPVFFFVWLFPAFFIICKRFSLMSFMLFLNECKRKIPSSAIQDIFIAQKSNTKKPLLARKRQRMKNKARIIDDS